MAWSPWTEEIWQAKIERQENVSIEEILWRDLEVGPNEREAFLTADLSSIPSPFEFKAMDLAVTYTAEIIKQRGRILIYGDYDADGLTASAVMGRFFEQIGVAYDILIPDRIEDGYGLHEGTIKTILENPPELLLTVDCGTVSYKEIESLMQAEVPCIITDHHECRGSLPPALAILNPKNPDETYPFRDLAGVGVAFHFVWALAAKLKREDFNARDYLGFVAIGTVADAMPLCGVNRVLVKEGLKALKDCPPPGLQILLEKQGTSTYDGTTLGFYLAPRLNAAGRLGDTRPALDLLMTNDPLEAAQDAEKLEAMNRERRTLGARIQTEAEERILSDDDLRQADVLMLWDENWHPGVLGIVASRLVERFERPVALLAPATEGIWRASSRAPEGYDLPNLLARHEALLMDFGGHKAAAGFSVEEGNLKALRAVFLNETYTREETTQQSIYLCELHHDEVTNSTQALLEALGPYGKGREEPLFKLAKVQVKDLRPLSEGQHFSCQLTLKDHRLIRGIAFRKGRLLSLLSEGEEVDVYGTLEINEFRGKKNLQIRIIDLKKTSSCPNRSKVEQAAEEAFKDGEIAAAVCQDLGLSLRAVQVRPAFISQLYLYLKEHVERPITVDLMRLTDFVKTEVDPEATPFIILRVLELFANANLLALQSFSPERYRLLLLPPAKERVKLSATNYGQELIRRGYLAEV